MSAQAAVHVAVLPPALDGAGRGARPQLGSARPALQPSGFSIC